MTHSLTLHSGPVSPKRWSTPRVAQSMVAKLHPDKSRGSAICTNPLHGVIWWKDPIDLEPFPRWIAVPLILYFKTFSAYHYVPDGEPIDWRS